MKNIPDVLDALKITETNFYKHTYFKPFIQTYLTAPNLYKGKLPFKLLHKYYFRPEPIVEDLYKEYKHFDIFIGYRWLTRKFQPLFISATNYDDGLMITGFSTYAADHPWYHNYVDLGFISNNNIILKIENRVDFDNTPSLDLQIKSMGNTVLKHLNNRRKK